MITAEMTKAEMLNEVTAYASRNPNTDEDALTMIMLVLIFPWTQAHPMEVDGEELTAALAAGR